MEGDSVSSLINLIKKTGYNKDIEVRIGVIESVSPLKIKISNSITLDDEDIVITNSFHRQLTNNLGKVTIGSEEYEITNPTDMEVKVGQKVLGLLDSNEYYLIDRLV